MTYTIKPSTKFAKDLKRVQRRGWKIASLTGIVKELAAGKKLLDKHRDHDLVGNFTGLRECHIEPDWLLIYEIDSDNLMLYLVRTGSHSDLY